MKCIFSSALTCDVNKYTHWGDFLAYSKEAHLIVLSYVINQGKGKGNEKSSKLLFELCRQDFLFIPF